jgi:predicted SnoaL-like aldol condensation-catalyzing enzyme
MRTVLCFAVLGFAICACSDDGSDEPDAATGVAGASAGASASGSGGSNALGGASGVAGAASSESGASGATSSEGGPVVAGLAGGGGGASEAAAGGNAIGGGAGAGGAPAEVASTCDPALSAANEAVVAAALDELFVQKDATAVDRYWAEPYLQHNPAATSGVTTFRGLAAFFTAPDFNWQRARILGECDLVVVQGIYSGTGVIFDMFRVQDSRIMEHWDSDSNQGSETDGPSEVTDLENTAANRALVLEFVDAVLIGADLARIDELVSPSYVEHHTSDLSGPAALRGYLAQEAIGYERVHHVIADGNFVFTLSEGDKAGTPFGLYDLYRVEAGQIAEHWDAARQVPATTASGLPIF